jgi:glycolate oxidase FAD binding subunit
LGLVYASFALPAEADPEALASAWRAVDAVATETGAAVVLEAAPAWAKRGRDVFGDIKGALPLVRRLKRLFDPDGLLNPGRFAGHV